VGVRAESQPLSRLHDHGRPGRTRGKITARLDWEDQAADVRWSIEQGKKKRRPPTDDQIAFLASEPNLDRGASELKRAYVRLSTCRSFGQGFIGPIPATAVWEWQDRNGITDPALRRHIENVLAMIDGAALRRANRPKQAEGPTMKTAQKSKAATPPQRRRKR
jgi:hypothetical protein